MNTKLAGRCFGFALLAHGAVSANAGYIQSTGTAEAAAPATTVDPAALEATLPASAEKARATFDRFLDNAVLRDRRTGSYSAVRVVTDGAPVWLFGVTATEEGFTGSPAGLEDEVAFTRADVVDWSHTDHASGRLHGNFASRGMMDVLPPHRAALIAATLAIEPLPAGW